MKANQKFLRAEDEAVSPVIAVILMVAITVVLAATVYVWVSGFGGGGQAAKSIALTSNGVLSNGHKNYTIASATQGMKWSDLTITINGATHNQTLAATDGATACPSVPEASNRWLACAGSTTEAAAGTVDAGNVLKLRDLTSGQTLRILDSQANSVILTLTVG